LLCKKMPAASNASKQHPEWMNKLFPIVFCLAGLALLVVGSQELIQGYASKSWRTTEGEITESRMTRTGSERKGYRPEILYSYEVEAMQFSSDRILFGMSSYRTPFKNGRQIANEWLAKYPQGSRVSVAYDPTDPSRSSLNVGAHITAWVAPAMGVPFLIVGLFMFRPKKKKPVHPTAGNVSI
jgi:hypothetical protein